MLPQNYPRSDEKYNGNEGESFNSQIFEKTSPRIKLLRKLYGALVAQWIVVGIFVLVAFFESQFRTLLKENYLISLISGIVAFLCSLFALIFRPIAVMKGLNLLLFLLFTLSLGLAITYLAVFWQNHVLLGLYFHIIICFLFLFFYTNLVDHNLTFQGASFAVISANLLAFELNILFTLVSVKGMIFLFLGGLLWGFYAVYITQTIMGTSFKFPIQDFLSMSVSIYTEVIYLAIEVCDLLRQLVVN